MRQEYVRSMVVSRNISHNWFGAVDYRDNAEFLSRRLDPLRGSADGCFYLQHNALGADVYLSIYAF